MDVVLGSVGLSRSSARPWVGVDPGFVMSPAFPISPPLPCCVFSQVGTLFEASSVGLVRSVRLWSWGEPIRLRGTTDGYLPAAHCLKEGLGCLPRS